MSTKIQVDLLPLWHEKEKELGKRLTIKDVAEATELAYSTVANFRAGKTKRFDEGVLAALCEYFGVPPGSIVPFLIFSGNNKGE
jgi:DNA-binding Xre family transcriptional regulator